MREQKTITIIGGGFTGSTVAIQQIKAWQAAHSGERLKIRIIDPKDHIGPGHPYDHDTDVFLLNQPAYAMSPFPEEPDHFTRWLRAKDSSFDQDSFAPRCVYGEYLAETFNRAVRDNPDITAEHIKTTTTAIDARPGNGFSITNENGSVLESDSIVIADGHFKSGLLSGLENYEGYFTSPHDIGAVRTHLEDDDKGVLLIGTGQSAMDTLAVLDHIGYKGPVWAASRQLITPWAFHPEKYRGDKPPYEPAMLTAQSIKATESFTFEKLDKLLTQEFDHARKTGYDIGHVLAAYDEQALAEALPELKTAPALSRLSAKIKALYGNPTAPDRYQLLQKFIQSGQLRFIRGQVKEDDIIAGPGGFRFKTGSALEELPEVSALFNGASCARSAIAPDGEIVSPLLRDACKKGFLKPGNHKGAFAAGAQNIPGLYLNGPATNSRKWGVESFRDDNKATAEESVRFLIDQQKPPNRKRQYA